MTTINSAETLVKLPVQNTSETTDRCLQTRIQSQYFQ